MHSIQKQFEEAFCWKGGERVASQGIIKSRFLEKRNSYEGVTAEFVPGEYIIQRTG